MTFFDLLFIVLFLSAIGTLVVAAASAARGKGAWALILMQRLAVSAAVYFVTLLAVSLASPQRFAALGDDQCSDDWCIAAANVRRTPAGARTLYEVTFRLSSRAQRVSQREHGVTVYLRDARGRRYDPDPAVSAVPFDVELQPGQAVDVMRVFTVPSSAAGVGLVVTREGAGAGPGCCIIGDESSFLHKKTIVRLE
jgi:hypothetical protein